jgi:hypothetical protein
MTSLAVVALGRAIAYIDVVKEERCKDLESRGLMIDAGRLLSLCHGSDGHANEAAGRSHFA